MSRESNTDARAPDSPSDISGRSVAVITHRVHEQVLKRDFWPKVRRFAAGLPFAADLVALYYCARDPDTPVAAKGVMLAALAYFVMPLDAIPDLVAGIGFTDDAAVLTAAIAVVGKYLKPRHRDQARAMLNSLTGEAQPQ